jgi:CRP-like cAMP-binding protein
MSDNPLTYIQTVSPFKDLPAESVGSIAAHLEQIRIPGGKIIFEAGAPGDSFYIIRSGTVQVYIKESDSKEKIILSQLTAGDYFGEMALLTGEPRSASIETLSEVTLIKIDKPGFERLIKENPLILLPLTHMLSHRLKNANVQRIRAEKQLLSKIKPSGRLSEITFAELLKYCEQNSLTGKLILKNKDNTAEIVFSKGIAQQVKLNDLNEAEALDVLMQWNQGSFVIEPSVFSFEEEKVHKKEKNSMNKNVPEVLEQLIYRSFEKLIAVVGSQILKEVVGYALKELTPFFPTLEKCTFSIVPKITAKLVVEDNWSDKHTLAVAVFLQTIFKNCRPMVVGMNYFNIEEIAGKNKQDLDSISFFQYMAHANEFAI